MILVKNSKCPLSLLFFEEGLDVQFYNVVFKKDAFVDSKMSFSLGRKICIFIKGLTHAFSQKFEISFESAVL